MSDSLLSPEQVAEMCGLSRRAVYRAIERGELAASRLCHRLRVRPADVDAWVAANRVAAHHRQALPSMPVRSAGGLRRLLLEDER